MGERSRSSSEPKQGGKPFTGQTKETKACGGGVDSDTPSRLCEGTPGQWGPWGPCSVSCGSGGTQQRSRVCDGVSCPDFRTKEVKMCSLEKCPEKSKYGEWSQWSCSTKCFNPLKRGGTSQTRTRTCTDDTPRKHRDYNCDTIGRPLQETVTPCTQDPVGYMTRYGVPCLKAFPCDTYGEDYYWCRTGDGGSDWDYCSVDKYHTRYGVPCYNDACSTGGKGGHESYNWCYTDSSENWDYCSP